MLTYENGKEDLVELFNDYISAWNDRDYKKIATEIYRAPISIYDEQTTTALDADQLAELLRNIRVDLDASGFSHSTLEHVGACYLSDNLAFATFHYNRFNNSEDSLGGEMLCSAYIVRKIHQKWRLVAHIHPG